MTTSSPSSKASALHAQALALAHGGQLRAALPVWGEALRQDPNNVDILLALGHALGSIGEHAPAVDLAERAAKLSPSKSAPWLLLGLLKLEQQDLTTAIESLLLARERAAPDERDVVVVALGQAYLAGGHVDEAVAAVVGVDAVGAHIIRSHGLEARGDVDGARAALVRAGEVDPDHPEPYKRLAALLALSEPSLAKELARHALALAPDDTEARALVDALA